MKDELTKEFNAEGVKSIDINNYCADITIIKKNTDKITLRINKNVGGKNKDEVKEAFDKINYDIKIEKDKIVIDSLFFDIIKDNVTTLNVKTYLEIPDYIDSVNIDSEVGDINLKNNYESIKVNVGIGDIVFDGSVNNVDVNSNTGDMNFELNNLKKSNNYKFNINVGDININIPKATEIKLNNIDKDMKIDDKILIKEGGINFEINRIGVISDISFNAY